MESNETGTKKRQRKRNLLTSTEFEDGEEKKDKKKLEYATNSFLNKLNDKKQSRVITDMSNDDWKKKKSKLSNMPHFLIQKETQENLVESSVKEPETMISTENVPDLQLNEKNEDHTSSDFLCHDPNGIEWEGSKFIFTVYLIQIS
jgi:hypothetical protein